MLHVRFEVCQMDDKTAWSLVLSSI